MPPKKNQKEKAPKKDAKKNVADKTFGLKNKNKSSKVQKHIKELEQGVMSSAQAKKEQAFAKRRLEEKKAAEAAKAEAQALMSSIVQQKVPFGVDPKSVLCVLFRDGKCPKGAKCKFSHDLNVGKKATKKDLYTDDRAEKEKDTMDTWDEEKLRSVIKSKHGNPKTTTDKVCKFFIEAVEDGKYGWFWICPNGGTECKYRHSLPEGFVLKTKEQKRLEKLEADQQPKITLEEFIETERGKLPKTGLTPITIETFQKWKSDNKIKRLNAKEKEGKKLNGKEIILKKFANSYNDDNDNDNDQNAWDLSQFKKALEDDDKHIKDYGDGENVTFDLPPQNQESESNPTTETITSSNEKAENEFGVVGFLGDLNGLKCDLGGGGGGAVIGLCGNGGALFKIDDSFDDGGPSDFKKSGFLGIVGGAFRFGDSTFDGLDDISDSTKKSVSPCSKFSFSL
ncbi:hypothetical protein WICMUC_001720 [Wickerhamomyces mucosus]|uniref:C3H1-type domain-containing protein n=1 Tax=Wickerhamomyces mucosus TaxID=1378264 RepID=A0A9P8PT15_9ASCO|nr:hypothetical protein WICMUC_001720 [Wickerhamomyces mucosus]